MRPPSPAVDAASYSTEQEVEPEPSSDEITLEVSTIQISQSTVVFDCLYSQKTLTMFVGAVAWC